MYLLIFSSRLAATVVFLLSVMSLPEVSSLINLDRVVDSIGSRHWLLFQYYHYYKSKIRFRT